MFLKVKYGELASTNIKGVVTGSRATKLYVVYEVDEKSVEECLRAIQIDSNVVQVVYNGNYEQLRVLMQEPTFLPLVDKRLTYEIEVNSVDENLYLLLQGTPQQLTVVLNLPAYYNNMRELVSLCLKHPNVRINGGNLLRIEGLRVGGIDLENLPKKMNESKIPYVSDGKTGIYTIYTLQDVVDFEYVKEKEKKVKEIKPKLPKEVSGTTPKEKTSKPKVSKRKSAINSLLALQESVGNNF